MLKALKSIVNVKRPYSRVTELEAESDSDEAGTDGVFDNGVDFQKSAITGVGPFKNSKQTGASRDVHRGKQNDSYMSETTSIDIEMTKAGSHAKGKETLDSENSDDDDKPQSLTHALDLPPPWEKPGDCDISLRPQSVASGNKNGVIKRKMSSHFESTGLTQEINRFDLVKDGSQVLPALLIAACGLFLSGYVLDITQHWPVFEANTAYFMAIPMLLGLKGSLDMTLASRLATASHSGYMDDKKRTRKIIIASLALVQVQAIACALITSIASIIISSLSKGSFNFFSSVLMCASVLTTMSTAAFILGSMTAFLITCSIDCRIDPDNIVTPIVSSFGDACTTGLLALFSTFMYDFSRDNSNMLGIYLPPLLIFIHFALLPIFWRVAKSEELCSPVLKTGWPPILTSLAVSQVAGILLEQNMLRFKGIAVLVPYINGIGGNLGSIYASRLCSSLHTGKTEEELKIWLSLLFANLPLQSIFLMIVFFADLGHVQINWLIIGLYLFASTAQVVLVLLFVAKITRLLFRLKIDPDNYATPWLTALGDVLGTLFLVAAFYLGSGT